MAETKPSSTEDKKEGTDWSKILTAGGGLLAALAALLTALNAIGLIGKPAATPTATHVPTVSAVTPTRTAKTVFFSDDFGSTTSGWGSGTDDDSEWGYQDGEYRILVTKPNLVVWVKPGTEYDLADLNLSVEAHSVAGTDDNEYGVVFRYVDGDNFYKFTISSDGQYRVQMQLKNEWVTLKPWAKSSLIHQGHSTNLIRVEARGTELKFFVNGEMLTIVDDATFASGNFALVVGTFDEAGVEVRFDSLTVRSLP
ncbi:MAG TPA: hypothetical protein PKW05_05835 [Anaerolineae bacterium]|nr:hypothetical protein [Anaerolineae bacterium]HQJ51282.1 hypothetical protein [Anaerolineae bacterium]